DENQDIKQVYAYEEHLNEGETSVDQDKQPIEETNQPSPGEQDDEKNARENLSLAKDERVPEKLKEEEIKKNDEELNEFGKYFVDGEKYYRKKRYYEAILNFKKAITIKYDAWQVWYNLGLVFYDIDEKSKSIECFEQSLLIKPNELDTMLNLGSLYNDLGQYDKGARHLIEALKMSKYQADAWLLLGKIMLKLNYDGLALFCFNEVLQYSKVKRERNFARDAAEEIIKKHPKITGKDPRLESLPPGETDVFKLRF
nr:tetratricopeptide repeat protein [Candidatus Sigynarchaeota archaeon]